MTENIENFLYHGTWVEGINILEPRQAKNGDALDGNPAVFASNDIDYAIFMALIGTNRWGGWSSKKYPGRGFYLHEEFLDDLAPDYGDIDGYVYFLDANDFSESKHQTFRSEHPVKTLGSIAVSAFDLPSDITILSYPDRHAYAYDQREVYL